MTITSRFICALLCFFAISLLSLYPWLEATFGAGIPPEQVIFHLLGGVEGVQGTDVSVFAEGIHALIVIPLAITLFLFSLAYLFNQTTLKKRRWGASFIGACILLPALIIIPVALTNQWIAFNLEEPWNSFTLIKQLINAGLSPFSPLLQHQIKMGALFIAFVYALIFSILLALYFVPPNIIGKHLVSSRMFGCIARCSRSKITYALGLALSVVWFFYVSHFYVYLTTQLFGKDYFTALYLAPKAEHFKALPEKPKNLILIYVESLERGLMNPAVYGENLIAPIDRLPGDSISEFPAAPGTTWSIAGMVASQCALPLRPSYEFLIHAKKTKNFLPGAICLGDILRDMGYTEYFLAGTDLKFANMDRFYLTHGYEHAYGSDEWARKGIKGDNGWGGWGQGLSDDSLLNEAKKIIAQNKGVPTPFLLTLITTDTHAPNGFPSKRCLVNKNKPKLSETFKCSSGFIAQFIQSLKNEGLLKNTVVVIMGDHPFAVAKTTALPFPKPRYVYFRIFGQDVRIPTRDTMTHFDVAPTILDSLGILQSPDQRLGLGYSLYSQISADQYQTHLQKVLNPQLLNSSLTYELLWAPKMDSKPNIETGHLK